MKNIELRAKVLLTMQVVLLGAVVPEIRAVLCSWTETCIHVRVIFDSDISDDQREMMSEVETEIISHFPDVEVTVKCEKIPAPNAIVFGTSEAAVYRRHES